MFSFEEKVERLLWLVQCQYECTSDDEEDPVVIVRNLLPIYKGFYDCIKKKLGVERKLFFEHEIGILIDLVGRQVLKCDYEDEIVLDKTLLPIYEGFYDCVKKLFRDKDDDFLGELFIPRPEISD